MGSMETRDAGGLTPSGRRAELQSCASRSGGSGSAQYCRGALGGSPRSGTGEASRGLQLQPTNSGAEREVGRAGTNCSWRKRESQTPLPLTPAASFLASQPGGRNFLEVPPGEETSPQRQNTLCLPSWAPLPSRCLGCFLRWQRRQGRRLPLQHSTASLIRALGNNFPPRARQPRKR